MSQRRILITGATGGLGRALVHEARSRGHGVRAVGRSGNTVQELSAAGADFVRVDLEDPAADYHALFSGCESVIHAAALSASWGPRQAFVSANIEMTQRVLEAAANAGVERFVFVSSPSIYARFEDQLRITEENPPNPEPLNFYAETKLESERAVLAANSAAMATCALRPRALVGKGDRVILPKLAELARRKRMPLPGGGKALIELTALPDAARAICEAEQRAPAIGGEAINISGGEARSVHEIATRLAEALGTNPRLITLPLPLAKALATAFEGLARLTGTASEPVLTRYTLATLGYSQTFDLTKARALLDFEPQQDALNLLLDQAKALAHERPQ